MSRIDYERFGRLVKLGHRVSRLAGDIAEQMDTLSVEGISYEVAAERTSRWLAEIQECEEQVHAIRGGLLPDEEGC